MAAVDELRAIEVVGVHAADGTRGGSLPSRVRGDGRRFFMRVGLTLLVLAAVGYFIAYMTGETYVAPHDAPGVPGKFSLEVALAWAIVLGCAIGAGLTRVWSGPDDETAQPPWLDFLEGFFPWLIGGVVVMLILWGIALGFEALGVGIGE